MQKANSHQDKLGTTIFFLVALVIVLADQMTKTWIRANLSDGEVIWDSGLLRIINIHNTGAAFGLFQRQSTILTIIACIGIPTIIACALLAYRYLPFLDNTLDKVALGLVLGGTIGNLVDRLHLGFVTDFIDFRVWPAFNVADAAVTTGVIIVAYSLLRLVKDDKPQHG